MDKDYTGLLGIMEKQLEIYRTLLSFALEKQPVLVKGNLTELEKITKEEELLILQVGRLEEQRQVLHRALANHFVLSPEELTLSELIKRCNDEYRSRFELLHRELKEVIGELNDINRNNTDLINSSLSFINFSMNILAANDEAPFYGETDRERKSSGAKIFDRTI